MGGHDGKKIKVINVKVRTLNVQKGSNEKAREEENMDVKGRQLDPKGLKMKARD